MVRSGTKTRAGTNAGTDFPLFLNEMSGIPPFTPIFHGGGFNRRLSIRAYLRKPAAMGLQLRSPLVSLLPVAYGLWPERWW